MSKFQLPQDLKHTLHELEGALSEWEKISPDPEPEVQESNQKEALEKELQNKAKIILNKLKDQIEELS